MEHHTRQQYYHQHYNLYSILGLPCYTSDEAEVGKAFLKQSQMYHPNRNPDPRSLEWFQTIEHAYDILKNQNSRTDYDKFLASTTQHDFNRSQAEAKQQTSYLSSWMTSWDRKQDSHSCLSFSGKSSKSSCDNNDKDDTLMNHIQALEREVSTLKTTNSKIWAQASCHLANADALQREKVNLQNTLEANQEVFHRREWAYVSRIRSLESTVACLRRSLLEECKQKETNSNKSERQLAANAQVPTLIVKLNSQPVLGSPNNMKDHGGGRSAANHQDNKTPTKSNLTHQMATKAPVPTANKPTAVVVKVGNENAKQQHDQVRSSTRSSSSKRPYDNMPSLVDKENLDDACKINVKRVKQSDFKNHHHRLFPSAPPAPKQQKPTSHRKELGVVSTNKQL
mmetsp:Transcript_37483/g.90888  ORF Transcript_37483/g.90888 Transcript_37483/m.90888 type:complete len:396 (-) Transcript_37483:37-1224(-)